METMLVCFLVSQYLFPSIEYREDIHFNTQPGPVAKYATPSPPAGDCMNRALALHDL